MKKPKKLTLSERVDILGQLVDALIAQANCNGFILRDAGDRMFRTFEQNLEQATEKPKKKPTRRSKKK